MMFPCIFWRSKITTLGAYHGISGISHFHTNSCDNLPSLAINVMNWGMPSPHFTHFYTNHFGVSNQKPCKTARVCRFERAVISTNAVFGLFARLARETVTSTFKASTLIVSGASNLRLHKFQIHTIHTPPPNYNSYLSYLEINHPPLPDTSGCPSKSCRNPLKIGWYIIYIFTYDISLSEDIYI